MCLATPGEVIEIQGDDPLTRIGRVRFGGAIREVFLVYTPEAQVGDFVLAHVGYAISIVQPEAAKHALELIDAAESASGKPMPEVRDAEEGSQAGSGAL